MRRSSPDLVACGPCTVESQRDWQRRPIADVMRPQPVVRAWPKRDIERHLREYHRVGLDGKPLP